jgi:hypothetical protein
MYKLLDNDGIELQVGDMVNVLYDLPPSPGNDWCGDIAGETGILKYGDEDYYIEWQQKKFREEGYYTATLRINDSCAIFKVKECELCHNI